MESAVIAEVRADHEGWEVEVEQMDRDVAYLFGDVRHRLTRVRVCGLEGNRVVALLYETSDADVVKRARKLGWIGTDASL